MGLSVQALEAAYRCLEAPLYNYLFRWFWDAQVAEDLMHDAFERVWKRRDEVDEARLDALIWTTVINLARNRHRRRKRWQWLPLPPSMQSDDSPQAAVELDQREQRLRQALDRLPEAAREVLLLEVFSGIGRSELADMLAVPRGTLASRKNSAVRLLSEMLEEDDAN